MSSPIWYSVEPRWKSKGTKPKGTGQKKPAKRDQPKGTKTQKGPWPKGTMAKRDQGTKGTMAKRDQGTKGTKGQKGPRHKRDHGLFKMLIIEIQIIGIPIFNHWNTNFNHWDANLFCSIDYWEGYAVFQISIYNTLPIRSPGIVFLDFALGDKG